MPLPSPIIPPGKSYYHALDCLPFSKNIFAFLICFSYWVLFVLIHFHLKKKKNHLTAVPVGLGGGSRNENRSVNFNHFKSESHLTILQMRLLRQVK